MPSGRPLHQGTSTRPPDGGERLPHRDMGSCHANWRCPVTEVREPAAGPHGGRKGRDPNPGRNHDVTTRTRQRINYPAKARLMQTMLDLHAAIDGAALEPGLLALVRIRASQINGCAFCLDMHLREAREAREDQRRLDVLTAWRETSLFDPREGAALALTEAVTLLADRGVPDQVLDDVEAHFTEAEAATLLYAVAEINTWNRLAVAARTPLPSRSD
jgi:AhpD family alkylhydroperoxidase